MTTRRLDDLFIVGRPFTIDDGQGGVEVWLQKLSPLDADKSLRKANAAKARVLMYRNDEDSDEWLDMYADIVDFSADALIEYLVTDDVAEYREAREAEQAAEEEWAKDNYLQGLRDAWEETLKAAPEEDPEREKCLAELRRFNEQVDPLVVAEKERLVADESTKPIEQLRREAVRRFLDVRASSMWLAEFRRCEIGYGVRDAKDHDVYYFAGKDGEPDMARVRRLQGDTQSQLSGAYQELMVSPSEGKDSPEAPISSPPSGLSGEAETVQPSGPAAAAR